VNAGLEQAFELVCFGEGVERQRCVLHKLMSVLRDVVGDEGMSGRERRQRRREVLEDAAKVYEGGDEAEIRRRLVSFRSNGTSARKPAR